jgi:hypothetical protein
MAKHIRLIIAFLAFHLSTGVFAVECDVSRFFPDAKYTFKQGDTLWNILVKSHAEPLLGKGGCIEVISSLNPQVVWDKITPQTVISLFEAAADRGATVREAVTFPDAGNNSNVSCQITFDKGQGGSDSNKVSIQENTYIIAKCSGPAYIHSRVNYSGGSLVANNDSRIYPGENKYLSNNEGMELLVLEKGKIGQLTGVDVFITDRPISDPNEKNMPMGEILSNTAMANGVVWHKAFELISESFPVAH